MSLIVYINSQEVELSTGTAFSQTKQANDLADLTSRQSNFTQNLKLPKTAQNERILLRAGLIGSESVTPYRKCDCDVIDSDSGYHLIKKGWAVLLSTDDRFYNVTVYDGSIDFYRAIENITVTQVGISDLNHIKSLSNIVASWTNTDTPYRYILADYNGDNIIDDVKVNIDYQVPSANCKYIWDRIFDFIGFTYSGSIFNHEKFTDLWLTFPKPTGEEVPNKILINEQQSSDISYVVNVWVGNALFQETRQLINPIREGFFSEYAQLVPPAIETNTVTGEIIPFVKSIQILQSGVFSFDLTGLEGLPFKLRRADNLNQIIEIIDFTDTILFNANAGDLVSIFAVETVPQGQGNQPPFGFDNLTVTFSYVDGFAVNFEEIFIDFKVSDFVREILVRFGLTPFKDKFSNHVKFLTLNEILQNPDVKDWSKIFGRQLSESYRFGNYAKRNLFKYKYNDDANTHFDGFIEIDNDNLAEEVPLFQSQIYAPERQESLFLGGSKVYKIWDREIKEDSTIDYKDLDGRFYFQRSRRVQGTVFLASAITEQEISNSFYYRESYHRLTWQEVIYDWYAPLNLILNRSKLITVEVWLTASEFATLQLEKLIYIAQLSQYFLINKVSNWIKGKATKVELIKVDYYTVPEIELPTAPSIEIDDVNLLDCALVFDLILENLEQPTTVTLIPFTLQPTVLGVPAWIEYVPLNPITATLEDGQVSFDISSLPPNTYRFVISGFGDAFTPAQSQQTDLIVIDGSCYDGGASLPGEVTITDVKFNGVVNQFPFTFNSYDIFFTFDELPPGTIFYNVDVFYFATEIGGYVSGGQYTFTVGQPTIVNALLPIANLTITKIQIAINGVVSNEFTL
jgi:hypothetical protein